MLWGCQVGDDLTGIFLLSGLGGERVIGYRVVRLWADLTGIFLLLGLGRGILLFYLAVRLIDRFSALVRDCSKKCVNIFLNNLLDANQFL